MTLSEQVALHQAGVVVAHGGILAVAHHVAGDGDYLHPSSVSGDAVHRVGEDVTLTRLIHAAAYVPLPRRQKRVLQVAAEPVPGTGVIHVVRGRIGHRLDGERRAEGQPGIGQGYADVRRSSVGNRTHFLGEVAEIAAVILLLHLELVVLPVDQLLGRPNVVSGGHLVVESRSDQGIVLAVQNVIDEEEPRVVLIA